MRRPVLLGLCPIGKFVFSHEEALRMKRRIQELLRTWGVSWVDLDDVLVDGIVRDQKHVDIVVRYFREKNIDALFIPHCNFGTEGAAALIAKKCGVPTLLWGERDDAPLPDGTRLRDSMCGMLATSGVMNSLGVPFTYVENCRIDAPLFRHGVERFVRAARVVATLKNMRIGQVGQRIDFFWSTIINEAQLLEQFGVQVLPIDLVNMLCSLRRRLDEKRSDYQKELATIGKVVTFHHFPNEDAILANFALRDILVETGVREGLDGFCFQTFDSIPNEIGAFLTFGCSLVDDLGYQLRLNRICTEL